MLLGIAILITAGLAFLVVMPLLAAEGGSERALPIDVTPQADLKRRRAVIYENIQDLDFEHKAGKISGEDYQAMRQHYLSEAAQLMLASEESEAMNDRDAYIEREVAACRARSRPPQESYVCPKCGYENAVPVKFCGECGARIAGKK